MDEVILSINSGSSSIKFSIYTYNPLLNLLYHGEVEHISDAPCLTLFNAQHIQILKQIIASQGVESGLLAFFAWFEQLSDPMILKAVAHRIVHGGRYFSRHELITDDVLHKMTSLIPLAPFHQPASLEAIKTIKTIYPNVKQVACFDTVFHRTQAKLATYFSIPRQLTNDGVIRYGFHGISYEYIASIITQQLGDIGNKRVIVAHLGNGASMCAMYQGKSVATSMSFTPLDGLMMGTRSGTIDPGLILYLLQEKQYSVENMCTLLYQESGLLGVSGISSDMRSLEYSQDPNAIEAVDLFCYRAARELCALCVSLQGCDAIVFTAGIGEKSAIVRQKICEQLEWLGVVLDDKANAHHASIISQDKSRILVSVIPTNEEYMIAKHTLALV